QARAGLGVDGGGLGHGTPRGAGCVDTVGPAAGPGAAGGGPDSSRPRIAPRHDRFVRDARAPLPASVPDVRREVEPGGLLDVGVDARSLAAAGLVTVVVRGLLVVLRAAPAAPPGRRRGAHLRGELRDRQAAGLLLRALRRDRP